MKEPDPHVMAYFQAKRQNELARYLQRGRRYRQTPIETLKDRWVVLMRQWADAWSKDNWGFDGHGELDDIGFETELRDVKLPGHLVKDVFESLRKLADKMLAEPRDPDPEADERVRKDFARVLGLDEEKN